MKRFSALVVLVLLILLGCESKKPTPQQKLGDITGTVYAMGTRLPIAGALVNCAGATDTSDASGQYHLLSVPVGARELSVSKAGYSTYSASIDVEEGTNTLDAYLTTTNATMVFYSERTGNTEVFVMDSDGSGQSQVTHLDLALNPYRVAAGMAGPLWAQAKEKIAFTAEGGQLVTIVNPDGSGLDTVGSYDLGCALWDVSPDGSRLLFSHAGGEGPWPLYVISVDGTEGNMVTWIGGFAGGGPHFCGNSKVVLASWSGPGGVIFSINTDGTGKELLVDPEIAGYESVFYYLPVGSPDGDKVAFGVNLPINCVHYALGIVNWDGSEDALLAHEVGPNGIVRIQFSPDGSRLLFVTNEGDNSEIYVINVDGSGLQSLTGGIACADGGASWSPDGGWIVFTSRKQGNKDIYKVNVDGSHAPFRLTSDPADDFFPDW